MTLAYLLRRRWSFRVHLDLVVAQYPLKVVHVVNSVWLWLPHAHCGMHWSVQVKRDAFTESNLMIFIQWGFQISLPQGPRVRRAGYQILRARGAGGHARIRSNAPSKRALSTWESEGSRTKVRKYLELIAIQISDLQWRLAVFSSDSNIYASKSVQTRDNSL